MANEAVFLLQIISKKLHFSSILRKTSSLTSLLVHDIRRVQCQHPSEASNLATSAFQSVHISDLYTRDSPDKAFYKLRSDFDGHDLVH